MTMNEKDVDRLARSYIKYALTEKGKEKDKIFDKEIYEIDEMQFKSPENIWSIILKVHDLTDNQQVLGLLSAWLLEGLLAHFPDESVGWVEQQAKKDPRFKKLLRGVWQNTMSDEIWMRVQKARD